MITISATTTTNNTTKDLHFLTKEIPKSNSKALVSDMQTTNEYSDTSDATSPMTTLPRSSPIPPSHNTLKKKPCNSSISAVLEYQQHQNQLHHYNQYVNGQTVSGTQNASLASNTATVQSTFPADIIQILHEVARTGSCSSLPWCKVKANSLFSTSPKTNRTSNTGNANIRKRQRDSLNYNPQNTLKTLHPINGLKAGRTAHTSSTSSCHDDSGPDSEADSCNLITSPLTDSSNQIRDRKADPEVENSEEYMLTSNDHHDTNITQNSSSTSSEEIKPMIKPPHDHNSESSEKTTLNNHIRNHNSRPAPNSTTMKNKPRCSDMGYTSCSESISSVDGASVLSIPSSSTTSFTPQPLQKKTKHANQRIVQQRQQSSRTFTTLRSALRIAVEISLDSYKLREGYKMSPAEKRSLQRLRQIYNTSSNVDTATTDKNKDITNGGVSSSNEINADNHQMSELAYTQRRNRLLTLLGGAGVMKSKYLHSHPNCAVGKNTPADMNTSCSVSGNDCELYLSSDEQLLVDVKTSKRNHLAKSDCGASEEDEQEELSTISEPPFTLQRVAEILLTPEKYYVQTHKLCNALEKLLLITSTSRSFGGVTGGNTSQNRREERELAALAEKQEQDESLEKKRRLRRLSSQASFDSGGESSLFIDSSDNSHTNSNFHKRSIGDGLIFDFSRNQNTNMLNDGTNRVWMDMTRAVEDLPNYNRSALDEKFESAGSIDGSNHISSHHSLSANYQEELTSCLNSSEEIARSSSKLQMDSNMNDVSNNDTLNSNRSSFFLFNHQLNRLNQQTSSNDIGASVGGHGVVIEIAGIDPLNNTSGPPASNMYLDSVDQGRSSASNSDVDSDVDSFDDSASDRSDGSDSAGSFTTGGVAVAAAASVSSTTPSSSSPSLLSSSLYGGGTGAGSGGTSSGEAFTAARVMALNRIEQQRRREQFLLTRGQWGPYYLQQQQLQVQQQQFLTNDAEYQSGDSIDSMMAEDSGGSDSSSSDQVSD